MWETVGGKSAKIPDLFVSVIDIDIVIVFVFVVVFVYGIKCNANEASAYTFASERKDIHHASGSELWTFG